METHTNERPVLKRKSEANDDQHPNLENTGKRLAYRGRTLPPSKHSNLLSPQSSNSNVAFTHSRPITLFAIDGNLLKDIGQIKEVVCQRIDKLLAETRRFKEVQPQQTQLMSSAEVLGDITLFDIDRTLLEEIRHNEQHLRPRIDELLAQTRRFEGTTLHDLDTARNRKPDNELERIFDTSVPSDGVAINNLIDTPTAHKEKIHEGNNNLPPRNGLR